MSLTSACAGEITLIWLTETTGLKRRGYACKAAITIRASRTTTQSAMSHMRRDRPGGRLVRSIWSDWMSRDRSRIEVGSLYPASHRHSRTNEAMPLLHRGELFSTWELQPDVTWR